MKTVIVLLAIVTGTVASIPLQASSNSQFCREISGAVLIANDGTMLGRVAGRFSGDSIFNEHGRHGSRYASASIWNKHSRYGSEFARNSPFNASSSTPPVLVKDGRVLAHITVNASMANAVNPWALMSCKH